MHTLLQIKGNENTEERKCCTLVLICSFILFIYLFLFEFPMQGKASQAFLKYQDEAVSLKMLWCDPADWKVGFLCC